VKYAENYERCCKHPTNPLEQFFVRKLGKKAKELGQESHHIWSLKYILDNYFEGREGLRVLDCGAWDGWFLSYDTPVISQKVALDFDTHYGAALLDKGIDFVLSDMEKAYLPFESNSFDLLVMVSTLEHLGCPEKIATEIERVLKPGGITFITVPDIMKYGFKFWDDVTHKRPFTSSSLRFLFETHDIETLRISPYNHNFFIAGNLFSKSIHERLISFRADALMYIGQKKHS
jgi:SAM-dependent methyltransferase